MESVKIQCRKLNQFKYELTAQVSQNQVQKVFDKTYRKYQQKVSVSGFRKGKVPLDYIKKNYLSEIKNDVIRDLVNELYREGIKQHQLNPIDQSPQLDIQPIREESSFDFKAQLEVHPQVEVKNFKNLKIEAKKEEVDDKKVLQVIEDLRESSAQKVPLVELRPCREGDLVSIDISGVLENGPSLPEQKDVSVELGKKLIFPEVEKALVGSQVLEEKTIQTHFPKEHTQFPNKKVTFKIKVQKIFKKVKPEINDEWAQTLKIESVEKLKEDIRLRLNMQFEENYKEELREKVLQDLVQKNPVEIPPSLLALQKRSLLESTQKRLKNQGVSDEQIQKMIQENDKKLNQQSLFQIQAGYLIQALVQKFNFKLDREQTRLLLEKTSQKKVDDSMVESFHWQRMQTQVLDQLIKENQSF